MVYKTPCSLETNLRYPEMAADPDGLSRINSRSDRQRTLEDRSSASRMLRPLEGLTSEGRPMSERRNLRSWVEVSSNETISPATSECPDLWLEALRATASDMGKVGSSR